MVRAERMLVTPTAKLKTRLLLFPLTARCGAPGPLIRMLFVTKSSPLVSVIIPVGEILMTSPEAASAMTCRSEPGPESLRFFT
jgi:ABC-type arginine transport system permease subunit